MSDIGVQGVRVVVTDVATGRVVDDKLVHNNYLLICVGNRYTKSLQVMGTTHVIAVDVRKPDEP